MSRGGIVFIQECVEFKLINSDEISSRGGFVKVER